MTAKVHTGSVCYEELQLLTFTIMGTRMGVDTSQVSEMLEPQQAFERGINVHRFNEELSFRDNEVIFRSPKVLLIKKEGPAYGILIDQPEEIESISLNSIRPLPALVSSCKGPEAIWGAAVKDEEIILLVDFYRLIQRTDTN